MSDLSKMADSASSLCVYMPSMLLAWIKLPLKFYAMLSNLFVVSAFAFYNVAELSLNLEARFVVAACDTRLNCCALSLLLCAVDPSLKLPFPLNSLLFCALISATPLLFLSFSWIIWNLSGVFYLFHSLPLTSADYAYFASCLSF